MNVLLEKKCNSLDMGEVLSISSQLNINKRLVELLYSRGLDSVEKIRKYLYADVNNLYDPFLMKGMSSAVDRINEAINNNESVVVYGDYDADGVCAAAILSLYLSSRGLKVCAHIPNRIGEGYGLNVDSIEKIINNVLPDLIITCDCGISGVQEVEFAMDLGVDVIVTDHHEVGEEIPNCIVVNPKQSDCCYPDSMLCGAGVALKLVQALGGNEAMNEYLDLACVATIADLVPLMDENRLIVQLGLQKLKNCKNLGLRELFANLSISNVTSSEIAYKIAPRINAAGRMGDAYRAFELLTSHDYARVKQIINEINDDNNRRKMLCDEMYSEAVGDLAFKDVVTNKSIVLSHPSWEKGITGIVAARLTNDFNRPTFILVNSGDDTYKGTCRSIDEINLYDLLTYCQDSLIEFGGHNQAAGFSIKANRIDEFEAKVNEYLSKFNQSLFVPKVKYDLDVVEADITQDLVNAFEMMEPFGNGNTRPLVRLVVNNLTVAPCKNNPSHVTATTQRGFQTFAFSYSKQSYKFMGKADKELIIELQEGIYGNKQPKGILKYCIPNELFTNELFVSAYPYDLLKYANTNNAKFSYVSNNYDFNSFIQNVHGTLFIAQSISDYQAFSQKYKLLINEYIYSGSKNNYTKIMIAPSLDDMKETLPLYKNIVFLSKPIDNGVICFLNSITKAQILVVENELILPKVAISREVFANYYEFVKKIENVETTNIFTLFKRFSSTMSDITIHQFIVCVNIFKELGLIEVQSNPYKISIIPNQKVDLKSSYIYNLLS